LSAANTCVVVLAAGRGSRLGSTGAETPKWLLPVGDRTIAERQLEAAEIARRETGGAIGPVHVVTGHADGAIGRFLADRSGDGARTLHNPDFAALNNWYSVLLALRELDRDDDGSRIVIVNGDLFARPAWIAAFLAESATTDSTSLIGVDLARRLTDESMKVSVAGEPQTVELIGKVGVEDPAGEYVGLLMARGPVLRAFRAALERFVGDDGSRDEWYERAVGLTAAEGTPWFVWPTPDSDWVEIDDDGDLQLGQELASREPG
jgi:choline kinase